MTSEQTTVVEKKLAYCSFCGKSQQEVDKIIAGPDGVMICNECVELCSDIIIEDSGPENQSFFLISIEREQAEKLTAEGITALELLRRAFKGEIPPEATVSELFAAIAAQIAARFNTEQMKSEELEGIEQAINDLRIKKAAIDGSLAEAIEAAKADALRAKVAMTSELAALFERRASLATTNPALVIIPECRV